MRYRNPEGVIVPIPGAAGISRAVNVTLTGTAGDIALDTSAGAWLEDESSILRYRNDTFAFEFDAPANVAQFGLDVGTLDLVGLALDADPSTPTDWTEGAWSAYEDAAGVAGDVGGVDGSTVFATSNTIAALAEVVSAPAVVGEGDAALEARLQALALESDDLAAHDIGRSSANRVQWAYVASDEDGVDVEGRPEAAFFVNATTHAREWAAPEVATGTLERLLAGADDRGIVRFLLDNTRAVVIPVHNIDGFLQTQRYPTQAIVGLDPDVPSDWPRDGRMRRKNMPGVDEVLTTFGDHLGGIDLNRNHPPLWATSVGNGGSSANPDSLTYHGAGPHSEAENLSLENAAELGPATRLRLGVDVHVYGKVFFTSNTGRERLNTIQANLVERLRTHHRQVSDGSNYQHIPDPPNRGIGAAAEYFAYEWLVPAWTLELEPNSSALEYGGTSVTHSGFILPASEARRVREAWAETHLVAFYMMAGPAHLARVRFVEADTF